jgi:hypothetical protein
MSQAQINGDPSPARLRIAPLLHHPPPSRPVPPWRSVARRLRSSTIHFAVCCLRSAVSTCGLRSSAVHRPPSIAQSAVCHPSTVYRLSSNLPSAFVYSFPHSLTVCNPDGLESPSCSGLPPAVCGLSSVHRPIRGLPSAVCGRKKKHSIQGPPCHCALTNGHAARNVAFRTSSHSLDLSSPAPGEALPRSGD